MRWWAVVGACGAVVLAHHCLVGCSSCTAAGCTDGVAVRFSSPQTEPGVYEFEMVADSEEYACSVLVLAGDLPDAGAAGAGGATTEVPDADLTVAENGRYGSCQPIDVDTYTEHGPGIDGVSLRDATRRVLSITLSKDGVRLATDTYYLSRFQYDSYKANGPGCGPTCYTTHVTLDVP